MNHSPPEFVSKLAELPEPTVENQGEVRLVGNVCIANVYRASFDDRKGTGKWNWLYMIGSPWSKH